MSYAKKRHILLRNLIDKGTRDERESHSGISLLQRGTSSWRVSYVTHAPASQTTAGGGSGLRVELLSTAFPVRQVDVDLCQRWILKPESGMMLQPSAKEYQHAFHYPYRGVGAL